MTKSRGRGRQRQRRLARRFDRHRWIVIDNRAVHGRSVDVDRALNDVKDQIAKIRTDCRAPSTSRSSAAIDIIEGLLDRHLRRLGAGAFGRAIVVSIDDTVARDLQSIHGVGEVKRFGGVDREIRVALDPEKLLALGVTAATVNEQVRADNVDLGGGRGELAGQEQAIRTLAGARKLEDLAALPIALSGGRRVRLDELGTVTDGAAEPRTFTRLFDEPIVAFGVTRAKGASDVTVDALIEKRLEKIAAAHPEVKFTKVDTQVDSEVAIIIRPWNDRGRLAIVVCSSSCAICARSSPRLRCRRLSNFWAMDAIGFSLNLVSLLAITLTGILVDDAIVETRTSPATCAWRRPIALRLVDEIGLAVIAISPPSRHFSPVSFMGGIAGNIPSVWPDAAMRCHVLALVARFVRR